jgi:hypothetical protein
MYKEDGGSLSFTAFDSWTLAEQQLNRVVGTGQNQPEVPMGRRVAEILAPNDDNEQRRLIQETVYKAAPVLEKIEEDTNGRLSDTIQQLRGCKKNKTIEALNIEIEHVHKLPWAVPLFVSLSGVEVLQNDR